MPSIYTDKEDEWEVVSESVPSSVRQTAPAGGIQTRQAITPVDQEDEWETVEEWETVSKYTPPAPKPAPTPGISDRKSRFDKVVDIASAPGRAAYRPLKAMGRGIAEGVTTELPAMVGEAAQFTAETIAKDPIRAVSYTHLRAHET